MEHFKADGAVVTGLNVPPAEATGTYEPFQLTKGYDAEFYISSVDGVLSVKTDDQITSIVAARDKQAAYDSQTAAVEARKAEENLKSFAYGDNTYASDDNSRRDIESVFGQCAHISGTDPIPTFKKTPEKYGKWLTVEGTYVSFTCTEFIAFAQDYFNRFSWNFDNMVLHLDALGAMNADSSVTAEEILKYDISIGWK